MLATLIVEILNILDITTTEYALKKGLGEEHNPLMKKDKIRRAVYPLKLTIPLIIGYLKICSKNPSMRAGSKLALVILCGWFSAVDVNNLWVNMEEKRRLKKEKD